jgi:hypothetical protein
MSWALNIMSHQQNYDEREGEVSWGERGASSSWHYTPVLTPSHKDRSFRKFQDMLVVVTNDLVDPN